MKSIKEKINESIKVNEAKNTIMGQAMSGDPKDGIAALNAAADKFESVKPSQLKRVFKDVPTDELKDYAIVLQEFAAQIYGIMSLAEDYPEEEATYFNDLLNAKGRIDNMVENLISNDDLNNFIYSDDDVYDLVEKVLDKINEISKVVLGKEWA